MSFLESEEVGDIVLTLIVRLWYLRSGFAARSMPKHPLSQIIEQGQFFHVYLLCGEDALSLQQELAEVLTSIQEINGHQSVDIHRVQPEEGTIDVETVKSFRQLFTLQAVSKVRVGVIENIDVMTAPAQQMLLKLLEESPQHSLFLLTTTRSKSISKPILSRTAIYRLATKVHVLAPAYQEWFNVLFNEQTLLIDKQGIIDQIDKECAWSEVSFELSHYLHQAHVAPATIQKWLFTLSLGQQSSKIKSLLEYFFFT